MSDWSEREPAVEPDRPPRICIAYDRLYPWSIGGAERWYRLLAERLAEDGHSVTYLTTRQWPISDPPRITGVSVVGICAEGTLYGKRRRRLGPVLRFGGALFAHLLRHGHEVDVVHTSAMSAVNALAVGVAARIRRFRLVLDWWEVWSPNYWRSYLGPIAGAIGWLAQRQVARVRHDAVSYSGLHAARLRRLRPGKPVLIVRGLLPACIAASDPRPATRTVVYPGRFIPEKQVPAIVLAVTLARQHLPELRAVLFGDGPDSGEIRRLVQLEGLNQVVSLPGFVADEVLRETLGSALCLLLLSRREGYGLIIAEAAALGVPSIVLDHPDSSAAELIVDGVNGAVCSSADPAVIASAILRVHHAGDALRSSTLAWFRNHERELSIESSLPRLKAVYRGAAEQEHPQA